MRIKVYGLLKDFLGEPEIDVKLGGTVKASELLAKLSEKHSGIKKMVEEAEKSELSIIVVVNGNPAKPDTEVSDEDVVVLLPPAAGG